MQLVKQRYLRNSKKNIWNKHNQQNKIRRTLSRGVLLHLFIMIVMINKIIQRVQETGFCPKINCLHTNSFLCDDSLRLANDRREIEIMIRGRILERFTRDLKLRWTFQTRILPNSTKLWICLQRALLYRHFMKSLE